MVTPLGFLIPKERGPLLLIKLVYAIKRHLIQEHTFTMLLLHLKRENPTFFSIY